MAEATIFERDCSVANMIEHQRRIRYFTRPLLPPQRPYWLEIEIGPSFT